MPCLLVFRKNFPQSISKVWTGDKIFCVVVKNILKMSLTCCEQKQTLFVNRSYRFSSIFRKSSLSIIETNLKQTVKKVSFQIIKKSVWNGQWPLGAFFVLCHCFLNVWNVLAYPSVVKGENCCFRVNFTPSVVEWLLSPRERIYVMVHRTNTFVNLW